MTLPNDVEMPLGGRRVESVLIGLGLERRTVMTLEQQEPGGQCILCSATGPLHNYLEEDCVCTRCHSVISELKELADNDDNSEAKDWLRRARIHIAKERKLNAPALVYARTRWNEMARSSQNISPSSFVDTETK